jgi:hypothetical protein
LQDEVLTVKMTLLLLVPPFGTVTTTAPVEAPLGTTTVIEESLQLSTPADAALNVTVLCPSTDPKFDPKMVTAKPAWPDEGLRLAIAGGDVSTVNSTPSLAAPLSVTTTSPVVAVVGTTATMDVLLQLEMLAAIPLKAAVLVP